jgi:hypothetical protein
MKNLKVIPRTLAILILLLFALSLTVSPSTARRTETDGVAVGLLTNGPIPLVNSPTAVGESVPGGPGFLILSSFDFKPEADNYSYWYNYTLLQNDGVSSSTFVAPVHLPQSAMINQMVVYFLDNDSGENIAVYLLQLNDLTITPVIMASFESSSAYANIHYAVTTSISYPVVDNASYSYLVQVSLPDSGLIGLNAVRIDYTYSVSLPAIAK